MDKQKTEDKHERLLPGERILCKKIDEDYFQLAERLIQKLSRKRSNPLASGHP